MLFLASAGSSANAAAESPLWGSDVNLSWFKKTLIEDNLAHWLNHSVTDSGFFRVSLDRKWKPAERQSATLVSQSRLLYVFSLGYELTCDDRYVEAVKTGADFLVMRMRDEQYGGWFWRASPSGDVTSDIKHAYGHAFVILGLVHAYGVTGDKAFVDSALLTWHEVERHFRDSLGGYWPQASRDFTGRRGQKSQNPIMHLFEALLALYEVTKAPWVLRDARELLQFVTTRLYRAEEGWIPELYDASWQPLPEVAGGHIDIGHQFEWAYLLSKGVQLGLPNDYLEIGERLLSTSLRLGFDYESGRVISRISYSERILERQAGWWQQCEALRALVRYAVLHGRDDLWPYFDNGLRFARDSLVDPIYGGWFPSPINRARKGSNWKVGYHVAGFLSEPLRLARTRTQLSTEQASQFACDRRSTSRR